MITNADHARVFTMYGPRIDDLRGMKSAAVAGDNFERSSEFESRKEPTGLRLIVFSDLLNA